MSENEKSKILEKIKQWWREELACRHEQNMLKLNNLDEFSVNPFLWPYLANFFEGNHRSKSLAKVLIYPRTLGQSITTTFGAKFQKLIITFFDVRGSQITGMDL